MINAVTQGALNIEKKRRVCSVGLDMVAVPDTWQTLSGIIADEAAIGLINNKTQR